MPARTLDWNDLTTEQKAHIKHVAELHVCGCCGDPGQAALDLFGATVEVIEMRDRAETEATLRT